MSFYSELGKYMKIISVLFPIVILFLLGCSGSAGSSNNNSSGGPTTGGTTTVSVTGVSLNKTTSSITVSGTVQLTETIAPSTATNQNVTWSTDTSSVATVSSSGLVTGVSAGSANIKVTTSDGSFSATCIVTVSTGGSTPVSKNIIVYDANGSIGNALEVYDTQITMYSSTGYIYTIDWNGNLYPNGIYYTGANCSGTPHLYVTNGVGYYGKSVYYGMSLGKIYIPNTVNSNGTSYYDTVNKIAILSIDNYGTIQNFSASYFGIQLKESDRTTTGIPATITPPIHIEFK